MPSDFQCEYCEGTVRPKRVAREAFKHKDGFVILEDVQIGVCDRCGNRYYGAELLRLVDQVASGKTPPERVDSVPVLHVP